MRVERLLPVLLLVSGFRTAAEAQVAFLPRADAVAPTDFTQVVAVRELSDGSVLVADRRENRVVLIDWRSGTTRELGRTGRGPREFESVGALVPLGDDLTLFPDGRVGRWNLIDGARMIDAVQDRSVVRLLRWRLNGGDERGRVLGTVGFLYASGPQRASEAADSLYVVLADWRTDRADTIARIKGAGQGGWTRLPAQGTRPESLIAGNPLDALEQALLFPDGAVAIARLDPYRVDWRLPDVRWVRGAPLPFEPQPVTPDVRCAAMVGQGPPAPRCDPDLLPGWPDVIPPFLRTLRIPTLHAAPGGALVVARTVLPGQPTRRYDLIGRDGRLAGVLELPADHQIVGFGAESVYVVTMSDSDLQTLTRHPWRGG